MNFLSFGSLLWLTLSGRVENLDISMLGIAQKVYKVWCHSIHSVEHKNHSNLSGDK